MFTFSVGPTKKIDLLMKELTNIAFFVVQITKKFLGDIVLPP